MTNSHILKNLHSLVRDSALTYMNDFVWQDIELTHDFKKAYKTYLNKNHYDIEFFCSTAVITSATTKYIFVPNQWFVIASFMVDVYEELQTYKYYFKMVADKLNRQLDDYAKILRDSATNQDREEFLECSRSIFLSFCSDENLVAESTNRLWRFVNDYSWWSGQKTIGRGDFHMSVILFILNLVNASQSFVGDIVSAYANEPALRCLVKSVDKFTVNYDSSQADLKDNELIPDEEIIYRDRTRNTVSENETTKPKGTKIILNEGSSYKEIKYRG